jgi:hypothetical protein
MQVFQIRQLIEKTFEYSTNGLGTKLLSQNIEYTFEEGSLLISFRIDVYHNGSTTEYFRIARPNIGGSYNLIRDAGSSIKYAGEEEFIKGKKERIALINGMVNSELKGPL